MSRGRSWFAAGRVLVLFKAFEGSFQVKCPHRSCKDSSGSFQGVFPFSLLTYVTNLIHFQVLALADQVEEARNDTMKLNNTVENELHELDNTVHELNNTVQDGLLDLDNTVHELDNTVQEEFHELNSTVHDELHDINNTVQDGLHDLDKIVHDELHDIKNTVQD